MFIQPIQIAFYRLFDNQEALIVLFVFFQVKKHFLQCILRKNIANYEVKIPIEYQTWKPKFNIPGSLIAFIIGGGITAFYPEIVCGATLLSFVFWGADRIFSPVHTILLEKDVSWNPTLFIYQNEYVDQEGKIKRVFREVRYNDIYTASFRNDIF